MPKTGRLNLRLDDADDELIRRASDAQQRSVSDFVLGSAREAAHRALADRQRFELDPEAWESFMALLDRPVTEKPHPRLARLLAEPADVE